MSRKTGWRKSTGKVFQSRNPTFFPASDSSLHAIIPVELFGIIPPSFFNINLAMHRQLYQRFKILRRNWVVSKIHWRDGEISHHVGVTFRASWWFFSLSPESLTRGSQPISCVGWRRISKINFESSFSNNVVDWLNPFPLISIKHTHNPSTGSKILGAAIIEGM